MMATTPALNLHGETRDSALRLLDLFLNQHFTRGTEEVLVIVGRGRVLFPLVGETLREHVLVHDAAPEFGGYRVTLEPSTARERL